MEPLALQQFNCAQKGMGKNSDVCIDKKELMLGEHYSYTN